jgi:chitodextrinase
MARNLIPLLGALALISCPPAYLSSQAQPFQAPSSSSQAPSSQALVGTWSTTINWNLPSGLMITTTFTANGQIQSTVQNHMGMSYTLAGTYQFNSAQGTLSYKWSDFSPKQTCVLGACTPAQPPATMGVVINNSIRFLSSTQFIASSTGGASNTYVRTNATGTPTP